MQYKVIKIRHPRYNHQLIPMLVDTDDYDFPLPSAAIWGFDLWHSKPLNTVEARLQDLAAFYEYVDKNHPSFFEDAAATKILTHRQITTLSSALLTNFKYTLEEDVSVKPSTFNRRIDSISQFLSFHYSRYVHKLNDLQQMDDRQKHVFAMVGRLRKKRYSKSEIEIHTNQAKSLTIDEVRIIKEIVRPSTENFVNEVNPFSPELQRRNACAILLLIELGCRAAELVLIKNTDEQLKFTTNPTVVITAENSNSSRLRYRSDGASHKTLGRELPISKGLQSLIVDYIEQDRPKLRKQFNGQFTDYLFVSKSDGGAMTTDGLTYLIDSLYRKVPNLVNTIHPHRLRVTKGIEVRNAVDKDYEGSNSPMIKSGDMQDTLTTWGGWSSTSTMPERYTKELLQQKLSEYLAKSD
ncbi:hypothetical protein AB6D66_17790 [Vibrio pomeroyi]|uniref:Tyr recombinase domain-containing protein n=1 Tax=Vibrio pomeroyi TaxID=198832 RepID=A0ABV4N0D7_9VIBR